METPTRSLPPSPEFSDTDDDWNRFGDEWRSFEVMDNPEKRLPSPPNSSHQGSFEVKSRTRTRRRPGKLNQLDRERSNERSNQRPTEVKHEQILKKRRKRRSKDHKMPLNQTPDTNETLNHIWEQFESVGTSMFRYFWPEKDSAETPSPKEQSCPDRKAQLLQLMNPLINFNTGYVMKNGTLEKKQRVKKSRKRKKSCEPGQKLNKNDLTTETGIREPIE